MAAADQLKEAIDAFQRGELDRARAAAEVAVASAPSPQWQHLLGLIYCRLNDPGTGAAHLLAAVDGEPENISYRVMLVRALVDAGRPAEALAVATPPSGSSPPELALWHARAEAADSAGAIGEAIEAWGNLCRAGIRDWRAWANFGNALAAAEQWSKAERAFRRAIEIDPKESQVRRNLAIACARQGRENEAADELLKWSDEVAADAESRILLARLLADLGREEESVEQLNVVLEAATGHPFNESGDGLVAAASVGGGPIRVPLLREIGRLMERTNRIPALRRLLEDAEAVGVTREQLAYPAAALALRDGDPQAAKRLLEFDQPYPDPLRAHWLMARIEDALGDPARAFVEAQMMNRASQDYEKWLPRGPEYIRSVRAIAAAVKQDWAARVKPLDPPARGSPVFLVGFPRSGTTLLDTFLMGHPDVAVLEEVPMVSEAKKYLGEGPELADWPLASLEKAREVYFASLDSHVPVGFPGLVIDKLPLNMLAPPFIHVMFPDAKFIFAQRHPCDSVLSCFMQPFALNESMACFLKLETAADFYDAAMTLWTRCEELLPLNVHRLIYEELVNDPEAALRPLVQFLGLEWRDELLDHRATAAARGLISTPSYAQVAQPISKAASGRWRRYEKQLEPVLPVLLPWAERLGYGK